MKKLTAVFLLLCSVPSFGATTYYYDPTYTGGANDGSQAHPWATFATMWSHVNTALGSGNVTVFFSSNVTDTNQIDLSQCTAASCTNQSDSSITCSGSGPSFTCSISGTNFLTLDGISQTNTGSHTVPSWAASGFTPGQCIEPVPSATNPPTYTCSQNATFSRYTIQSSDPITGPSGSSDFSNCVYNFHVLGFSFQGQGSQSANLGYTGNILFEYNEVTRISLSSVGPGLFIGPAQHGPCHTGAARPGGSDSGPDNVVVQYNVVHDEWGEGIYSGASTPDPFVSGGGCTSCQQFEGGTGSLNLQCGNGCNSNSTVCTTPGTPATCPTGAHYRINGNTVFGTAVWSGQGDGNDIKDGHTDLWIVNNRLWTGRFPNCAPTCSNLLCWGGTNAGTACTSNGTCTGGGTCQAANDGQGLVIESCSVVDSNQIQMPGHDGISIDNSWNNSTGRNDCRISNNIVTNINSGVGHNNGIELFPPNTAGQALWVNLEVQNNTVFNAGNNASDLGDGILIPTGVASGTILNENNIVHTANTAISAAGATSDHNDCFNSGGTCSGTGTITTDPKLVSTSTANPNIDTNFKLQSGSPAQGAGANLFSTITLDYFGNARPNSSFTIGAFEFPTTQFVPSKPIIFAQ